MLAQTTSSLADRKLESLLLLGQSLPSYSSAHKSYSALIHNLDAKEFATEWEASLYGPVRRIVRELLYRGGREERAEMLYCAPGAHAPLLCPPSQEESLCCRLSTIALADIDQSALMEAERWAARVAPHVAIRSATVDFTGGLGQRLNDVLRAALEAADDSYILERGLASPDAISELIFAPPAVADAKQNLNTTFDQAGIGSEHNLIVSEMVATFTGVPAWMAFRSAVLAAFPNGDTDTVAKCLETAWDLLRTYNRRFLEFHLQTLAARTARGGAVVAVFDATKRFDEPSFKTLRNLPLDIPLKELGPSGVRLESMHRLVWRDHPHSFPMSIGGIPILDFCAHSHDIDVLVYRITEHGGRDGHR